LPRADVDDIIKNEEKVEARCDFCGKVYTMGPDELAKKFEASTGDPSLDKDFKE
jgi:molecular chaperone Hsp33